jgi:hypothetical protein
MVPPDDKETTMNKQALIENDQKRLVHPLSRRAPLCQAPGADFGGSPHRRDG